MKAAAAIFALALGLRLLYLGVAVDRRWPHAAAYEGDAIVWAAGAQALEQGAADDDPLFFRANAPAHLLHWLGLPGATPDYTGAKVLWCLVSALACAGTFLVGARAFAPRVGLTAAGLQAFSWQQYVLATSLNTEALYALLIVLVLAGTCQLQRQRRPRAALALAVALGMVHGVAILVRIEHVLLLLLLVLDALVRAPAAGDGADAEAQGGPAVARGRALARRAALQAAIVVTALLICVPASVEQTRAARRYNTVARRPPAFDRVPVAWAPDARAFLDGLPAFARARSFAYLSRLAEQRGIAELTAPVARQLWRDEFGELPEPLRTPVFVSGQGPLNFALANHPDAHGAFSKAALENRFLANDPKLTLSVPPHLRIYNHGYAVGLGYIVSDPARWLRAVGRKLWFFAQGASLGLTAYNLPLGRFGERRPCDLMTPFPGQGRVWLVACVGLIIAGAALARRRAVGRLCLVILAYKLMVTVGFFGYARQAASIGPVLALLAALAIDALVGWLASLMTGTLKGSRTPREGVARASSRLSHAIGQRRGWLVVASIVALGVAVDLHAAAHPPAFDIQGPLRATPEWGESSFSSNARIELRPELQ